MVVKRSMVILLYVNSGSRDAKEGGGKKKKKKIRGGMKKKMGGEQRLTGLGQG